MPVICIMYMHALCILSRLRICMGCLGHGLGGSNLPPPSRLRVPHRAAQVAQGHVKGPFPRRIQSCLSCESCICMPYASFRDSECAWDAWVTAWVAATYPHPAASGCRIVPLK